MTLARELATMIDVLRLLREQASGYARRPTPERLAASLSYERLRESFDSGPFAYGTKAYATLRRFRTLRQDARVAAARRALRGDA